MARKSIVICRKEGDKNYRVAVFDLDQREKDLLVGSLEKFYGEDVKVYDHSKGWWKILTD